MRVPAVTFLALAVLVVVGHMGACAGSRVARAQPPIVGAWALDGAPDGVVLEMVFSADGTRTIRSRWEAGAMIHEEHDRYRVDGAHVVILDETGVEEEVSYEIDGDRLILRDARLPGTVVLIRQGL